ncbi:MAG: bifunctional nuclease family protein [candidate division WOR-3 bacterium]
MVEVRVEAILIDSSTNSPVALLREKGGDRVLPIFIGPMEAAAIAYALEGTQFARPLTLDLMRLIIRGLGGRVARVIVTRLEDDTFYAEVVVESSGKVITIDARPSDSIGLALRDAAPIYVDEAVMDRAAQYVSPDDEQRLAEMRSRLRSMNPEDFGDCRM